MTEHGAESLTDSLCSGHPERERKGKLGPLGVFGAILLIASLAAACPP